MIPWPPKGDLKPRSDTRERPHGVHLEPGGVPGGL